MVAPCLTLMQGEAHSVGLAFADQGYTGEATARTAAPEGIRPHVLKHPAAMIQGA